MIRAMLLMLATSTMAQAEPYTSAELRRLLPQGGETQAIVTAVPFLSDKDRQLVATLKDAVPYYGALALTPSEGLYVDWANAAGQFHSRASAKSAAITHCEASKAAGSAACVVVLEILPMEEGAASLSALAKAAFLGEFQDLAPPRVFAVSEQTGGFGFAASATEALIACSTTQGGPNDCRIMVRD